MKQTNYNEAKEVINSLNNGNFYCECPCGCGEEIKLKDADLFYLDDFTKKGKQAHQALIDDMKQQRLDLKEREKNMKARPMLTAKAVNIGFILERIAPAFEAHFAARSDRRQPFCTV